MKYEKYTVLEYNSAEDLAGMVEKGLRAGWELHGPLIVCRDASQKTKYIQAMIARKGEADLWKKLNTDRRNRR